MYLVITKAGKYIDVGTQPTREKAEFESLYILHVWAEEENCRIDELSDDYSIEIFKLDPERGTATRLESEATV